MNIRRAGTPAYAAMLLALTAMTACDIADETPTPPPSTSAPSTPASPAVGMGTLVSIEQKASYQVPTRRGEVIADGAIVIRNTGSQPIRLQEMQVVFASGGRGLTVEGSKIIRLTGGESGSIQRSFPPNKQMGQRWRDAVGAELLSGEGMDYQLVLGLSVSTGVHRLKAVRLTYSASGATREVEIPHDITVCVQKSANSTTC